MLRVKTSIFMKRWQATTVALHDSSLCLGQRLKKIMRFWLLVLNTVLIKFKS